MDLVKYRFPSRRMAVVGRKMIACGQQLASQAGLIMLQNGGSAVDAAIAAAIALTVVEPTSNGIGGDAFAIVWDKKGIAGLNSSGPAGTRADAKKLREMGFESMPGTGIYPVTVPGAPAAWKTLHDRYGKLPFSRLFEPAIRFAREGFPVSPVVAGMWESAYRYEVKTLGDRPEAKPWFQTFAPKGRAPYAGETFYLPEHAETLEELAQSGCESLYRGRLADKFSTFSKSLDGFITLKDLEEYHAEWVKPLSVRYRDIDVWEIPPNGHGIITLMSMGILNGLPSADIFNPLDCHRTIEALKLAFADGKRYVTDRRYISVQPEELLSEEYLTQRRKLIGETALDPYPGKPTGSSTVYLCAADEEVMISYIQSNYGGFGSGLVVPGTGIALQNRGKEFSLAEIDDNFLLPGKKTYHTIIPGFLSKDGKPLGPFGVMGGYMQPQGHLQVVKNLVDYHMNPQEALDAPRWQWIEKKKVLVEESLPDELVNDLQKFGHEIQKTENFGSFGRGQIILRTEDGGLIGGTEPRTDGAVLAF